MTDTPNPGSAEARAFGCICARIDNNQGKWPPFPATEELAAGWYVTGGCPLHDGSCHGV